MTRSAAVGSTVLNAGLRLPIDLARMAATVAALAGGGCELGLGAGWMRDDYDIAGVPFEGPAARLLRLEESVEAIKLLWSQDLTSYAGTYVRLKEAPSVLKLPLPRMPKLLLGGTMRRALTMAGRHAYIVSIFPSVASGKIGWPGWAEGSTTAQTAEQTAWVPSGAQLADRDPADLELSTQVAFTAVAEDPGPLQQSVATATGEDPRAQDESTIFLTGTPAQARERLQRRREATGLSYFVVFDLAKLPGQQRIIGLEPVRFQDLGVRAHDLTGTQYQQVTDHDLGAGNLGGLALPPSPGGRWRTRRPPVPAPPRGGLVRGDGAGADRRARVQECVEPATFETAARQTDRRPPPAPLAAAVYLSRLRRRRPF